MALMVVLSLVVEGGSEEMSHLCEQCKQEVGEYVVIDYEHVLLLCPHCLDEYEHIFGEIDTDSYHLKIGLYEFINRVNEILKYLNEMQTRFSDRYFAVNKLAEEAQIQNIKIAPEKLLEIIKW